MKPFLISYDLDRPGQNYERLTTRLKQLGAVRVLMSQWALKSQYGAKALRDDILQYMDSNDRLLVTQVGDWAYSNLMAGNSFKEIAA